MHESQMAHLALMAELDSLRGELRGWAESAPAWPPAQRCAALVRQLEARGDGLRMRLEAPLLIATLGGTGTGKSSLVNALVGEAVTPAGRQRPTTRQAVLITRPGLKPEMLGLDAAQVQHVERDAPALRDVAILDCPDPDTAEDDAPGSNLSRLREVLPACDVLLVTTTQQKYRNMRIDDEIARAAPGATLIFVQTHADTDDDIRDDWRRQLSEKFDSEHVFFVDSVAALGDALEHVQPRGEFARLLDLLTRRLAHTAALRIRRSNFLDAADEALAQCSWELADAAAPLDALEQGVNELRSRLATRLSRQMIAELSDHHRPWEQRILSAVADRWGFSPFAGVLRVYQGLGGLLSGATLFRLRSPAQIALWGVAEGGRRWRDRAATQRADDAAGRAVAAGWDDAELRTASVIVQGYLTDAGLDAKLAEPETIAHEAERAGHGFLTRATLDLRGVVERLAARHSGLFTRLLYESAWLVVLGLLIYRFGRNFFFDSWLAPEFGWQAEPAPLLGTDFFLGAAAVLVAWSLLLLWSFTGRLRRGLRRELHQLAEAWVQPRTAAEVFSAVDAERRAAESFLTGRDRLESHVAALKTTLERPVPGTGQRRAAARST